MAGMGRSGPGGMQGTLSKVINSLDKLVDLEKRIARLETDADGNHTTLKFKKGRQEATPTQSARNVFTVREVPKKSKIKKSPKRRSRNGRNGSPTGNRSNKGGQRMQEERRRLRHQDQEKDVEVMEEWMDKKTRQENRLAQSRRSNGGSGGRKGPEDMKMQNFGDVRREYDSREERQRRKEAQGGSQQKGTRRR